MNLVGNVSVYSARPDIVKKALKYVNFASLNKLGCKELELLIDIVILRDNNGVMILRDSSTLLLHFVCIYSLF